MTELLLSRLLHFAGLSLWIGGMIAMAMLIMAGTRNKAAGILADAGALVVIATGVFNAIQRGLFKVPWMHVKLTLVVVLIVVHALLRVRMRKGRPGTGSGLLAAVVLLAVAIQYCVVFQPFTR
jgi:uncharacterized membrane protein